MEKYGLLSLYLLASHLVFVLIMQTVDYANTAESDHVTGVVFKID